ncbi:MAG: hypothetical protein ACREU8_01445 [Gammaproteobacteria bacterium]
MNILLGMTVPSRNGLSVKSADCGRWRRRRVNDRRETAVLEEREAPHDAAIGGEAFRGGGARLVERVRSNREAVDGPERFGRLRRRVDLEDLHLVVHLVLPKAKSPGGGRGPPTAGDRVLRQPLKHTF